MPQSGLRVLGAIGDVNDINCWSNIPYHFFMAGKKVGFFDKGLAIDLKQLIAPRAIWNGLSLFRGDRLGGFQYTRWANERMAAQIRWDDIREVICHAQLFPPFELMEHYGISVSHYIDFPLPCLFDEYGLGKTIGKQAARDALARERDQYAAARFIVCMSPWSAQQVVQRCDVPAQKVYSILPGANLPEKAFASVSNQRREPPDGKQTPLRIAFVGKAAERKGLGRLVEGVRVLRARGLRACVRVIGPGKNLYSHDHEIEHVGFINKQLEPYRLIDELKSCHLGALPSYQEALGIAALEYLRCGLPALITRTGGLADSIPPDCGIILEQNCTGVDIADALQQLLHNPDAFAQLQHNAWNKAKAASWDRCVDEFQSLWASQTGSFARLSTNESRRLDARY
jgi:glycosyltransferase involved in cell wall biosynthesis